MRQAWRRRVRGGGVVISRRCDVITVAYASLDDKTGAAVMLSAPP